MDLEEIKKKTKELHRSFIIVNIGAAVLGIILIIFPTESKEIICRALGIMLGIWGIIRIVDYIRLRRQQVFGSFGLVQGCALLAFGAYIALRPDLLAAFITTGLSVILFICGILKLQNAIDFAQIKSLGWIGHVIAAVLIITAAVIAFFNPFGASDWLMRFVGIALVVSSIWDIASVIWFDHNLKELRGETKPKKKKKSKDPSQFVDVEAEDKK